VGRVLTAEGYVSDLDDGYVTMLRDGSSERTLLQRDVFGEPFPLEAPHSEACRALARSSTGSALRTPSSRIGTPWRLRAGDRASCGGVGRRHEPAIEDRVRSGCSASFGDTDPG
jgi:hypothetical protein